MATAAATFWVSPYGEFQLQRYPKRKLEPLQAWSAADGLLLEFCIQAGFEPQATLLANDEQGALSTALLPALLWTDSALTAKACEANLAANNRPPVNVVWSDEDPFSAAAKNQQSLHYAVLRVPKQLPYFEYQLAILAAKMPVGAQLVCGGMDKHLSPHTASLIEQYFGPVQRHPGARKARIFTAIRDQRPAPAIPSASRYFCSEIDADLSALANVFSRDKLDIGSRFLLQHLDKLAPVNRLADLACGNGVLGIAAFKKQLCQRLLCFDESAMAIASTKQNIQSLFSVNEAENTRCYHGDGLSDLEQPVDLILCNPPFHLGHTVDDYAGRRLLQQCAAHLTPGGKLCLVANAHLDYAPTLKRHFNAVHSLARNRKFIIWLAERR